jgi:hypothetical protein
MAESKRTIKAYGVKGPLPAREDDFHAWCTSQANALRAHQSRLLDWSGLAEELEDMGRKDRNRLRSHLTNLLCHLLKWAYQPDFRSNSWRATINASRDRIEDLLEESPTLRNVLRTLFEESKAYSRALRDAIVDTDNKVRFPRNSPWTLDRILDSNFFPD